MNISPRKDSVTVGRSRRKSEQNKDCPTSRNRFCTDNIPEQSLDEEIGCLGSRLIETTAVVH